MKLSGEVLRLHLQQLNLQITGTRPRLIERLRTVTTPASTRPKRRPSRNRVSPQPSDGEQEYVSDAGSSVGEDFEPDRASDRDLVFMPAQLAAIQDTISSTVQVALRSFPSRKAPERMYLDQSTPSPRSQNVATPLGLNRPLAKSLGDKILCGEYVDSVYFSLIRFIDPSSPLCSYATKSPPRAPRAPCSPW